MGRNPRCVRHFSLDLHTTPQTLRASSSRPPLRFLEDSLWSPLGWQKIDAGIRFGSLVLGGAGCEVYGGQEAWPPNWGVGQVDGARMTPKLGCRTGRWCKNDPQIRVSDRSVVQEWPPNLTSELSGRWKRPPNSMLGVVGRVKRTPKFDARGGRKGKTTPQIWCPGWSEG